MTLALSGCALSDSFEVGPFLKEQITGDTWRACLAREYQVQARANVRAGRAWTEATWLAAKGSRSLQGEEVGPEPTARAEFKDPLQRLHTALASREQNPCDCAKAQARFDGWVALRARDPEADTASARKSFDEALGACTASR